MRQQHQIIFIDSYFIFFSTVLEAQSDNLFENIHFNVTSQKLIRKKREKCHGSYLSI